MTGPMQAGQTGPDALERLARRVHELEVVLRLIRRRAIKLHAKFEDERPGLPTGYGNLAVLAGAALDDE